MSIRAACFAAIAAAIYLFFIRAQGEALVAPPAASDSPAPAGVSHASTLAHVLLALAVITLMARLVGGIFRRYLGQPPVMGEILAGMSDNTVGGEKYDREWPERAKATMW